jgi:hypothetical protein
MRPRRFLSLNGVGCICLLPEMSSDFLFAFSRKLRERVACYPKGAWPLVVLWPFGSVDLIYNAMDTEGKSLPED